MKKLTLISILMTCIFYTSAHAKEAAFMNFQKLAFYYSEKTQEYIIVAHSTDISTNRLNFDKDNVHVLLESKNKEQTYKPISREDITVINLGDFGFKGAEKHTLFRFSMVVDNSGSIDDTSVGEIERILTKFMNKIPLAFQAQIIKFSSTIQSKSGFIKDKNEIIKHINTRHKRGGTALHDSIAIAIKDLKATSDDVYFKFIVIFTDGCDTASQKFKDPNFLKTYVENECIKNNIPLFVVGVTNQVNQALLKSITDKIGLYEHVQRFSGVDIDNAFDTIVNLINDTFIFKIPAIGPKFEDLETIFLLKKKLTKYETIQDFAVGE